MIIEWTEPAELDLSDIYEFIARDVGVPVDAALAITKAGRGLGWLN